MARRTSARVVLNRDRTDRVHLAMATGVYQVAKEILREARPPDPPPLGADLVRNGGALLYRGRTKLAGLGLDGRQPRKPRSIQLQPGLTQAIVGYGFPGRFVEWGTVHARAHPFLTPASRRVLPSATQIMGSVVGQALAKIP